MLANVRQPFLHDPEDLDLLVRREVDRRVDLELDVEGAVRREHLDVPAQRRVERRRAARRGEREDRVARLLLGEHGGLLQRRQRLVDGRPGLEHRRVRQHREQVLRSLEENIVL